MHRPPWPWLPQHTALELEPRLGVRRGRGRGRGGSLCGVAEGEEVGGRDEDAGVIELLQALTVHGSGPGTEVATW